MLWSIWLFGAITALGMLAAQNNSSRFLPGIYKGLLFALISFGFIKVVVFPWLRSAKLPFVANLLRRKNSRLASATLASIELEKANDIDSNDLVQAHHKQVYSSTEDCDWKDVLPSTDLRKQSLLTLVAMTLALLIAPMAPSWLKQRWTALTSVQQASTAQAKHVASTKELSLFKDLEITIEPPAYTGLPVRHLDSSTGEITVLPGTKLTLAGLSKRTTASVLLKTWQEQRHKDVEERSLPTATSKLGQSRFETTWTVVDETHYTLSAQNQDGSWEDDPKVRTIAVEEDMPPRVDFQFPKDTLVVQSDTDIEVAYWIKDDYGIASVKLVIQDGESTTALDFFEAHASPRLSLEETKTWTFKTDSFSTGVPLPVFLEVMDNDDVLGPKASRSKTFYIVIESTMDKERNAIDSIKILAESLIESLARRLPLEATNTAASQSDINLSSKVSGLFQQAIVDVSKVQKNNKEWQRVLQKMATSHESWLVKERDQHATPSTNRKWVQIIEVDVLKLLDWLKRKQIEHIREMQKAIAAQQKRVAELMQKHQENPTPESEANLMRALEKLEKQMEDLAKQQAQLPSDVIDEYINKDASQNNQAGESCIEQVKSLLAQGNTVDAMTQMAKCKEEIEKQAKQMERSLDSLKSSDSLGQGKKQAEWMNKLNSILDKQQKIAEQTQGQPNDQQGESDQGQPSNDQKSSSPLSDPKSQERLQEAQKRLAEATQSLKNDPQTQNSSQLEEAADAMKKAENAIKNKDGQAAFEHMENALQKLNKAVEDAQSQQQNQYNENREKIELPGKDDHEIPQQLREDILEAMKKGDPPPEYKPLLKKYYEAITE